MPIPSPEELVATTEQIQAHFDTNDRFGIVGGPMRIGFAKFMTRLEWEHYSPLDEELNDRFQMFIIHHGGLPFILLSIPLEDRHLAEKIAAECDIRFADGIPHVFGGKGDPEFPIKHKNIWSCENLPNSGVYNGKSAELQAEEIAWLKEFWAKKSAERDARIAAGGEF